MIDNWLNLKQLDTNVSDYYAQFEEKKLRCAAREKQWVTVTRFINGVRDDLKGEVSLHHPESLMEAYQKALEIEKYKKPSYSRRKPLTSKGQSQNSQFVKSKVQLSQPLSSAKNSSLTSPPLLPSPSLSSMQGHPASRCPNYAIIIGLETLEDDGQIDETIYPVVGDTATESEHEDDERERHILFSMNVISKCAVKLLSLKTIPYSTPIKVVPNPIILGFMRRICVASLLIYWKDLQANSPEASFSKPGRDDGFIKTYLRKKYKNNN
ncbi:hypothetical protein Cgig2_014516 [Carnegiea gigantea]|uniref:Retrotransposon gag domain-containing protein n=1 Tax=Carnegiea gigantea TaxID=171969 RepID=A0A9Q1QIF0_9CARY|nr:hypothetical protein Cgig2_014516 [Carnegiea gigantea]